MRSVAKVRINHVTVGIAANRLSTPEVRAVCKETKELSQRWPRSGNPAYTYPPTGNLYRQTYYRVRERKSGPYGVVGNDSPIALAIHNGTKGHWIRARERKFMKFRWKRMGGSFHYFKIVWHRPLPGNHFLTEPLRIVAAKHGFKVAKTGPL